MQLNYRSISARQISDIHSILDSIAAIKTHQLNLSADLNALKDHLWQEVIATQEREKKSHNMINRILKFLAGVFGHLNYGRMFANWELEKEGGEMQSSRLSCRRNHSYGFLAMVIEKE
jgi:hypothetical protein